MRYWPLSFVMVLLVACKQEPAPSPAPAATLEGRWVWQRASDTSYDAAGKASLPQAQVGSPGDYLLVITATSWQHFTGQGNVITPPASYSRQVDTVTVVPATRLTVKELTPHSLVLYHRGDYSPPASGSFGGRTDTQVYYSR